MVTTLYEVLGVDRNASAAEIESACIRLAETCRPDRTTTNEAKALFADLELAYQILLDPVKREKFDKDVLTLETSVGKVTPTMIPFGVKFKPRTYEEAERFDPEILELSRQIMDLDCSSNPRVLRIVNRLQRRLEARAIEIRELFERQDQNS